MIGAGGRGLTVRVEPDAVFLAMGRCNRLPPDLTTRRAVTSAAMTHTHPLAPDVPFLEMDMDDSLLADVAEASYRLANFTVRPNLAVRPGLA